MRTLEGRAALVALVVPAMLSAQPTSRPMTSSFRHPLGYTFRLPPGWSAEDLGAAVRLHPPNAAADADGNPLEVFAFAGDGAGGATRSDDARVAGIFDERAGELRRAGNAEPAPAALGTGTILTYEGRQNDIDVRRRLYVIVHDGRALYLMHEARRDLTAKRESDVRAIFASLGYDKPSADPAVLGSWSWTTTTGSSDPTRGSLFAEDVEVVAFHPDGRVEYGKRTTVSGGGANWSAFAPGDPNVQRGRFVAAGGRVLLTWDKSEAEQLEYSVFEHEGWPHLKLQVPGEKPRYFRKVR